MILERLSKVQKKGQVTIPVEIRQKWALEEGDLVAFVETPNGVVISPQVTVSAYTLNRINEILENQGIDSKTALKSTGSQQAKSELVAPNGPDIVTFLEQYQPSAHPTGSKDHLVVLQKTFGAFQSEERPPVDFKSLREEFIGHLGTEPAT